MRVRAAFIAGIAALGFAAPAQADTWTVTDGSSDATSPACNLDQHRCVSLRTALAASEATKDVADVINVPAGTININNDLVIQSDITVNGVSARSNIIDGGEKYRGFRITSSGSAKINHFTIRNGAGGQGGLPDGGGILNDRGVAQLTYVRVTSSQAAAGGSGGGIANVEGSLTLTHGLVDNNTASKGAGLANIGGVETPDRGLLGLADATVFKNTAGIGGTGGIDSRGGTVNLVVLNRVTVADNIGGARGAGGLQILSGAAQVLTSVFTRNVVGTASSNCGDVKPTNSTNNVENEKECGFDLGSVNPGLATALSSAGGELDVLALAAASPAVDHAPLSACNAAGTTDQRGLVRPQGRGCDSGAYELDQAPTVKIESGPSGTINVRTATFTYSTTEPGVTLQCRLTSPGRPSTFVACDKPDRQLYSGLADASYTFSVRAMDGVFSDPPTASRSFTVDTIAPETSITGGPSGSVASTSATFTFTSSEAGSTFQCALDGAAFGACPASYTGLAQGSHTFQVRATDAAGNTDASPASRTWTVDTDAPTTTLTPITTPTNDTTPTFTFSSEAGATFQCRVDAAAFEPCASPHTTPLLAAGSHTFEVRAVDAAGNPDASPASQAFVIDTTAPEATIVSGPEGATTNASPEFAFSGGDAVSTACRLDGPAPSTGEFGPCASPKSFDNLAPGDYVFFVRSVDAAGNATTTQRAFTVTAAPASQPTPTPTPSATPTPTPTPVAGESVGAKPVSGTVLVKLPGSTKFVKLDPSVIKNGAEFDARDGVVELTRSDGGVARFYDGIFKLSQSGGITTLTLSEKLTGCPKKARNASAAAKKPKTRRLWGDGKGKFRTKGQYSAATVRGTKWLVQDTCTTTLTRVAEGVVAVRDVAKKKTIVLKKGKRYIARAKKR